MLSSREQVLLTSWCAGLDFYTIFVKNGTSSVALIETHTYLANSHAEGYEGLTFSNPETDYAGGQGHLGFNPASGVDALRQALEKLLPYGNSYVSTSFDSSMPFIFGKKDQPGFNFIQRIYRHSDNLQNGTYNLALEIARSSPAEEDPSYRGVAYSPETYFAIRWCKFQKLRLSDHAQSLIFLLDWISLPAVVLVVAYMSLLVTIAQTERRDVRPWKSDASMLVFADLDRSIAESAIANEALLRPGGMKTTIGTTKVGLRRNGGGTAFS